MGISQKLYQKAKRIIPGGTQLLSKRPEMFLPDQWPAYYKKAKGCEVWDLDNNKYVDMSYMGIGSCVLGYADDDVNKAVKDVVDNSSMSTLNCAEEVELAELLCRLHSWSDMARFARTGGEAMSIAVRIARSKTGKDLILFCGYHGWHDWYLAANLSSNQALDGHLLGGLAPKGVPRGLIGTAIPFNYNDTENFLSLLDDHRSKIAAVVMEPLRNTQPEKGFLEMIRSETEKSGIIMIFDEITAGWRLNVGGAHLNLGVDPDIAVFGKAVSNGYPMAAIIGKSNIMSAAQDSFISSTYWTERIGPVAALTTISKIKKQNIPAYLIDIGQKVKNAWQELASKHDLRIIISGIDPLLHFSFDYSNSLAIKTLFTQLMLEKGFLATNAFYASFAHKDEHLEGYFIAVDSAFFEIKQGIKKDKIESKLKGPVCHGGFKRLT